MNERSNLISKLQSDFKTRAAYIQAKVSTLVPSQIRALRLKSEIPRQPDLARAADMHQSRISMLETAGANPTLSTLSTIAAALKVGLKVQFVPFSEMLAWENAFSQDQFNPVRIDEDRAFLYPTVVAQTVCLPAASATTVFDTLPVRPYVTQTRRVYGGAWYGEQWQQWSLAFNNSPQQPERTEVTVNNQLTPLTGTVQEEDLWNDLGYQNVPVVAPLFAGVSASR